MLPLKLLTDKHVWVEVWPLTSKKYRHRIAIIGKAKYQHMEE